MLWLAKEVLIVSIHQIIKYSFVTGTTNVHFANIYLISTISCRQTDTATHNIHMHGTLQEEVNCDLVNKMKIIVLIEIKTIVL